MRELRSPGYSESQPPLAALWQKKVTGVTRRSSRPQSVLFPVSAHGDYAKNLWRSSKYFLSPNHGCQSALLRLTTFQIASAQPIKCTKIKAGASTIIWQDCGSSPSFSFSIGLLNIAHFQHIAVEVQEFHLFSFSLRSTKSFKVQNSTAMQSEPQQMACHLLKGYCFLEGEDPAVCLSAPSSQVRLAGQMQGNLWHVICLWILSKALERVKECQTCHLLYGTR